MRLLRLDVNLALPTYGLHTSRSLTILTMCIDVLFKAIALVSFSTFTFALSVSPQPSLTNSDILSLPSKNSSALLLPSANVSVSAPAFRTNNSLDVLGPNGVVNNAQPVCNAMFGNNLSTQSCYDALGGFPDDTAPLSFGARGHDYNIQLPRRVISR